MIDNYTVKLQINIDNLRALISLCKLSRALTLYELMRIMSIPDDWPIPKDTQESFLRRIIGEGIPPLFVKRLFEMIR